MDALTLTNCLTNVELALQYHLLVQLGKCLTVADSTALMAIPSASLLDGARSFVTANGRRYLFARYSSAAASGTSVYVPTDAPARGRWLITSSTSATGYVKAVELYEGAVDPQEILTRFRGARPGVMIQYDGDEWTNPSVIAGSFYRNDYRFRLYCVASNLRPEHQSLTGAGITGVGIAAEQAVDPGVNQLTGDVARVLAGSTLDDTPGIRYVEIKDRRRETPPINEKSLADRLVVYSLDVVVYASVENRESDGLTLDLSSFAVTRALANPDGTTTTLSPIDIVTA